MNIPFEIAAMSRSKQEQIESYIAHKVPPMGAMGVVRDVALRLALIQGTPKPFLNQPSLFLFAGDHGVAEEAICATPQLWSRHQTLNVAQGGASVCAFARLNRMMLRVVDAGLKQPVDHPQVLSRRIGASTKNCKREAAMSHGQLERALRLGGDLVRARCKAGTNVLGLGTCGVGGRLSADCILGYLLGDGEANLLRQNEEDYQLFFKDIQLVHGDIQDPWEILRLFGGFEFAMMLGAMLQCASNHITILVDGYIGAVMALLASRVAPEVADFVFVCQDSAHPGQALALDQLVQESLMSLGLDLDDGSGVALAFPLFQAAVTFLNEVASSDDRPLN
ncbi:nicotinate-nucleotide--dimethylbenzimidazole phosphoribosyltransferase [Pseudobacteriovorax antillogorgiicola]|uniref:Nicotinate-nucleotide--dimethylbenzimidazole phosphoribosyltransferase n=1 Tax=Pseudobacteriovorax antillogorgiicola TaxID=1513793 RepID=A0A1Y6CTY0_9BACT|nr:nicotinate-nucleotide--dimethylbenzimidazole phosphoribosyltransferase [Pseudobacteriovorax antillogorgiicola]TCS45435.1 nicotinate-nucleotide-dimethylbenzimidazole phosphoribosyltransferase [Pseudobacteriovorax antillogorgiicola]SMF74461.1 nicotinate-nucleotide-dimethylbenzimidazole phosphoribosyltransferase [Pseudobacteriovorax antillogorgiicola]